MTRSLISIALLTLAIFIFRDAFFALALLCAFGAGAIITEEIRRSRASQH